jgi:hypothetical protein
MGSYLSNFQKLLTYFSKHGANVTAQDKDGLTALDLASAASWDKRLAEVASLLEAGSCTSSLNLYGVNIRNVTIDDGKY